MKQKSLLKVFFLLCALIVGSTSMWADEYTLGWGTATGTAGTYTNFTSASGSVTNICSFSCDQNNGTTAPTYNSNNNDLRLYYDNSGNGNGGSMTITPATGVTITGAVITSSTGPSVKYSVDGGSATSVTPSSNVYTISNISASTSLRIQNVNTSNTQLRIKTIKITYTKVTTHTLNFSASNGTISVTNGNVSVASGSKVAAGTTLNVSASANTGYSFSTWTKDAGTFADASLATTTFTMPTSDATIGATFTLNSHSLDLSGTNGTFYTTINGVAWDGTSDIPYGAAVSITAVPNTDYSFKTWDATLASYSATDNPLVFTMPDEDVEVEATYVNADTEYNITIDGGISNGSVSSDKAKAKAGVTVELTATPNSGYAHTAWTVIDAESNVITVTNNQFTMPANNVTVSATFKKVHSITYYIDGVENNTTRVDGEPLALDTPSTSFGGWSTNNSVANPVFVSNSAAVTSDLTLYAIFIKGKTVSYNLVESNQTDWRGDYLIAYSNTIFADGRVGKDDGTNPIGGLDVKVNPGDNLSGKVVNVDWGDTYNVTLEAINAEDLTDGYVMKGKDNYYIYQTSNKNGITSSANKATAAAYPITITFASSSDIRLNLGGNAAGAVFRYNDAGYFRFYKDCGQSAVYLYKRTENPTYSLNAYDEVNITGAGRATFSSTNALDFTGTDVEAYIAESTDGSTVKFTSVNVVPANTGLFVKGDEGTYYIPVTNASTDDVSKNKMVSTANAAHNVTSDEFEKAFVFGKKGGDVGFFKAAIGKTVAKGKSYLLFDTAPAKDVEFLSIGFDDEENETTGVNAVQNDEIQNGVRYNLAGQRVGNDYKGIVIVNGKKVIIK